MSTPNPSLAAFAWAAAPDLCRQSGGSSCAPYHGLHPTLRRLRLISEPNENRDFLFPHLAQGLSAVGPAVLIAGAADEAMAELVVEAAASVGVTPEITVVDRCETPLAVNRRFGEATGLSLETACHDIATFAPERRYDLIATHSLLPMLPSDRRALTFRRWQALLRPGGRLITVARLRPHAPVEVRADPQAAERFGALAVRQAIAHGLPLEIGLETLRAAAVRYAALRQPSYPIRHRDEIAALVAAAGLTPRLLADVDLPGRFAGLAVPGTPSGGRYLTLVAER